MNAYMQRVLDTVKQRDGNEPEFIQTVEEVFKSLEVVIEKHPEYEKAALLECSPSALPGLMTRGYHLLTVDIDASSMALLDLTKVV